MMLAGGGGRAEGPGTTTTAEDTFWVTVNKTEEEEVRPCTVTVTGNAPVAELAARVQFKLVFVEVPGTGTQGMAPTATARGAPRRSAPST